MMTCFSSIVCVGEYICMFGEFGVQTSCYLKPRSSNRVFETDS